MGQATALKMPSWLTASKESRCRPVASVGLVKDQFPVGSTEAVPMIIPSSSTATWEFAVATPRMVGAAMVLNDPSALVLRILLLERLALGTVAAGADAGGVTMLTEQNAESRLQGRPRPPAGG
jgi:hypothetical protein